MHSHQSAGNLGGDVVEGGTVLVEDGGEQRVGDDGEAETGRGWERARGGVGEREERKGGARERCWRTGPVGGRDLRAREGNRKERWRAKVRWGRGERGEERKETDLVHSSGRRSLRMSSLNDCCRA